jgi:phytanoyl-CoA hydroxylase
VTDSIASEVLELRSTGFVVVRRLASGDALERLNETASSQLAARAAPLELEADLKYPGAPASQAAAGGQTVRRLLDAYGRHELFRQWATAPAVSRWMRAYFDEPVLMSRTHHNCVMTKHPRYGSLTGWHRDIRYWSFEREDLVSVWLALGEETNENGGLWFVPGSHAMSFDAERFDAAKFFRGDHEENAQILRAAVSPHLDAGDAVFFHCNTLHSAGQNATDRVKLSLVYTYHGTSNAPRAGTRSASKPEVGLSAMNSSAAGAG